MIGWIVAAALYFLGMVATMNLIQWSSLKRRSVIGLILFAVIWPVVIIGSLYSSVFHDG